MPSVPLSKAECLKRGLAWTPKREKAYNDLYLGEKRDYFRHFCLPFPDDFVDKFYELYKKKGDAAYRTFDVMCTNRCLDDSDRIAEVWIEYFKRNYHGKTMYDRDLKKKCGKYVLSEIEKSGLIEPVKVWRGAKVYQF